MYLAFLKQLINYAEKGVSIKSNEQSADLTSTILDCGLQEMAALSRKEYEVA